MLDGLFVTPSVTAITEALSSAAATEGPIAVIGHAKLAAALAEHREVIAVGLTPRAAKRLTNVHPDISGLAPGSCAAVIGLDVTDNAQWAEMLRAWSGLVRDGGAIVLVDRSHSHAAEASRRALCAGLSELEQRHAGRVVITSGLVSHLE
ncbi:MAG TPA: hypothetical protein VM513_14335 [Kofleriaceae bacterium]|nr:hypothetical protein [Kofleriaceae bacterium]